MSSSSSSMNQANTVGSNSNGDRKNVRRWRNRSRDRCNSTSGINGVPCHHRVDGSAQLVAKYYDGPVDSANGTDDCDFLLTNDIFIDNSCRRRLDSCTLKSGDSKNNNRRHPAFLDPPCEPLHLRGISCWDFDIFIYKRKCPNQLVRPIGMRLFSKHDLFRRLSLPESVVWDTLTYIESVYWHHNPYHTALHAADVTQALHCFISQPKFYRLLDPLDILSSLLAAFCHDADHPGVNQSCLERTDNFLLRLYSTNSVLEHHHASIGLSILQQSGLSKCLSTQAWGTVRSKMVALILATDMAHQGFYRAQFTHLLETKKDQDPFVYSDDDRLLLLQVALKCADVSNPCRSWPICQQWAHKVCQEFFLQGDQERLRWSLTPAKYTDRNLSTIPPIQIGFLEQQLMPLFTLWHEFFRSELTEKVLQNLQNNLSFWCLLNDGPSVSTNVLLQNIELAKWTLRQQSKIAMDQQSILDQNAILKQSLKLTKHRTNANLQNRSPDAISHGISDHKATYRPSQYHPLQMKSANASNTEDSLDIGSTNLHGVRRHSLPETQPSTRSRFVLALSSCRSTDVTTINKTPTAYYTMREQLASCGMTADRAAHTLSAGAMQLIYEQLTSRCECIRTEKPSIFAHLAGTTVLSDVTEHLDEQIITDPVTNNAALKLISSIADRRRSVPLIKW